MLASSVLSQPGARIEQKKSKRMQPKGVVNRLYKRRKQRETNPEAEDFAFRRHIIRVDGKPLFSKNEAKERFDS